MATLKVAAAAKRDEGLIRAFIGRAWVNEVNTKNGLVEMLSLSIDNEIVGLTLEAGDRIQLWPNDKREGKTDADYRASIMVPEDKPAKQKAVVETKTQAKAALRRLQRA